MKALWRYARQIQVLGEGAQRALLEGKATVCGDAGADEDALGPLVEALYLAGAGVGSLEVPSRLVADAVTAFNPTVAVTVTVAGDASARGSAEGATATLPPLHDPTARRAAEAAVRALASMARQVGRGR